MLQIGFFLKLKKALNFKAGPLLIVVKRLLLCNQASDSLGFNHSLGCDFYYDDYGANAKKGWHVDPGFKILILIPLNCQITIVSNTPAQNFLVFFCIEFWLMAHLLWTTALL